MSICFEVITRRSQSLNNNITSIFTKDIGNREATVLSGGRAATTLANENEIVIAPSSRYVGANGAVRPKLHSAIMLFYTHESFC